MAILILISIVALIIATIVLVTVPVRHVDAVASGFYWQRTAYLATAVWIRKKTKQEPRPSAGIRNVEVQFPEDPEKRRYTYEKRVWRRRRSSPASGSDQRNVHDPHYTLARNEEKIRESELYRASFVADTGVRYSASLSYAKWRMLRKGQNYRLGRNSFGQVRTVKPASPRRPADSRQRSPRQPA